MEVPTKAKMSGPRVIRIEKPEPEPKPRPPRRQPETGPAPAPSSGSDVTMPQPSPDQEAGRGSRRNKRRTTTPVGGRQGERGSRNPAPTHDRGDTNWRKQDLLERENRLRRSGGFFPTSTSRQPETNR